MAVDDRLGMRVERVLTRSDGIFITVTSVVTNSFDAELTTGFQGGLWTLILDDDRRISSTVESFDALARGTVSIWFPPEGIAAENIVALELSGIATRSTNTFDLESTDPVVIDEDEPSVEVTLAPGRIEVDAGVALTVDRFELSATNGELEWSLDGGSEANAAVFPILQLTGSEGEVVEVPAHVQTSGFIFFHPSISAPTLASEGLAGFRMPVSAPIPPGEYTANLDLQVTWATYQAVLVELPVDDVAVAVVD